MSLIGPTGSGKSTIANHLVTRLNGRLLKIAAPLYELQRHFYATIDKNISGQDGELLQFLGGKIEREQPGWLCDQFLKQLHSVDREIVVNDDCRPNCYDALRHVGTVFVHVRTSEKNRHERARTDHVPIDPNHPVERGINREICQFVIDNNGSFETTIAQCEDMISELELD
ncbi:hypothetical protein [Cucumibacter marinus]|uniref:hypothetical protein n=1 Tax=Cucumibacter marinus TaxID=1121252 RepID=UPI0012DE2EE6|nr:hypothetical protein [Cucumibacter marinus]